MHSLKVFVLVSAVTLSMSTEVRAQESSTLPAAPPIVVTRTAMERPAPPMSTSYGQDRLFILEVLDRSTIDAEAGKLATVKGNSPEVRQVGQRLIDDSLRMSQILSDAIAQLGVNPPELPSKKQVAILTRLNELSGQRFDQAFLHLVVRDQKRRLSDFQLEAAKGSTLLARHTAQEGAALIQEHIRWIQQIAQKESREMKVGE
jgi:putative membrane protein